MSGLRGAVGTGVPDNFTPRDLVLGALYIGYDLGVIREQQVAQVVVFNHTGSRW